MTPEVQQVVDEVQRMLGEALTGLVPLAGANTEVLGQPPFVILKPRDNASGAVEAAPLETPTLRGFYAT